MDNFFSWLKVKYWYHAFTLLGGAGTFISLLFDLKAIDNKHALLMSLGFLFIGIGEWINHPLKTVIMPPNANLGGSYIGEGHPRHSNLMGSLFDILGFILIATAVYKIANIS